MSKKNGIISMATDIASLMGIWGIICVCVCGGLVCFSGIPEALSH